MCSDLRRALGTLLARDPASGGIGEIAALLAEVAPVWLDVIDRGAWAQITFNFEAGYCVEHRKNETHKRPKRRAA